MAYKKKTKAEKASKPKRLDWEENQELIEAKYIEIFQQRKKPPSKTELAEILGISRPTVSRHLEKLDIKKLVGSNTTKLLANMILQALAMGATKGDVKAAELYFKIVYGSDQNISVDVTTKGEKIPAGKAGDTFQILIPEWQEKLEGMNKQLESGSAGR